MTVLDSLAPGYDVTIGAAHRAHRWLSARWMGCLLLAAAVLQQCLGHHNADNSWLISVAERWLAGAQAYVDVLETNPPGAFLIYAPAAALARLLHLRSELVVSGLFFLAVPPLVVSFGRSMVRGGLLDREDEGLVVNAGIFALLLLPGFSFGEREHLAAIGVLPMLGLYAMRAHGMRPSWGASLLAGTLGAVAVIAKPHFGLAMLLPFGVLAWQVRRPGLLVVPEHVMGGALVGLYVASLPAAFPAFFTVLPAILDVYVPIRTPLPLMLGKPWFLLNLILLAALAMGLRHRPRPTLAAMLLAGSLGFLAAFLVQMKGWVNHGLPGVSLAFLAGAVVVAPALRRPGLWHHLRRPVLFLVIPALLGAPILFGTLIQLSGWQEYEGLTEAVRRHGPQHPKLAAITGELDVGHPLVRRVDGTWAMRAHSLWLMTCAMTLLQDHPAPAMAARLEAYVAEDARIFREDVAANRPDLIIAQTDGTIGPVLRHPDIVAAMAAYAPVEVVGPLTVYARRASIPPG